MNHQPSMLMFNITRNNHSPQSDITPGRDFKLSNQVIYDYRRSSLGDLVVQSHLKISSDVSAVFFTQILNIPFKLDHHRGWEGWENLCDTAHLVWTKIIFRELISTFCLNSSIKLFPPLNYCGQRSTDLTNLSAATNCWSVEQQNTICRTDLCHIHCLLTPPHGARGR